MGWQQDADLRDQRFCVWCDLRVVQHHIGNHVVVWVHAVSNRIWCRAKLPSPAAKPTTKRKWNDA